MGFFEDKNKIIEELRGENNRLKFQIEDLNRTINSLKQDLQKQQPLIDKLMEQLDVAEQKIEDYHIDLVKPGNDRAKVKHQIIKKELEDRRHKELLAEVRAEMDMERGE